MHTHLSIQQETEKAAWLMSGKRVELGRAQQAELEETGAKGENLKNGNFRALRTFQPESILNQAAPSGNKPS